MAYYKKSKQISTKDVANRLAEISTVSLSDTYAVLMGLSSVLKSFMKEGHSVKLDGVGTFYYTADTSKQGVDTPEEVSAKQINGVRVRFLPEYARTSSGKVSTRALVDDDIQWLDIDTLDPAKQGGSTTSGGGTTTPGGGTGEDGEEGSFG